MLFAKSGKSKHSTLHEHQHICVSWWSKLCILGMPSRACRTTRDPWGQRQLHWQVVEAWQAPMGSAAEVLFRHIGGCPGSWWPEPAPCFLWQQWPWLKELSTKCGPEVSRPALWYLGNNSLFSFALLAFFHTLLSFALSATTAHLKLIPCVIFLFGLFRVMPIFLAGHWQIQLCWNILT